MMSGITTENTLKTYSPGFRDSEILKLEMLRMGTARQIERMEDRIDLTGRPEGSEDMPGNHQHRSTLSEFHKHYLEAELSQLDSKIYRKWLQKLFAGKNQGQKSGTIRLGQDFQSGSLAIDLYA
ncbi:MAG: hypothetical protein PHQ23_11215 [Candidatus Wallbacteria bacterium]|nr:hypothetical protein [Candidatus Wallbacteria bacterium]